MGTFIIPMGILLCCSPTRQDKTNNQLTADNRVPVLKEKNGIEKRASDSMGLGRNNSYG